MHLFNKENIWSNPHAFYIHPVIQTSTIILQTELFPKKRREKISKERYFNLRVQCFHTQSIHSTRTTVFPHAIQQLQVSTVNSTYRINSTTRNTTTTRLIPCHFMQINTRHLPVTVPRASKHSTWQNKTSSSPTSIPGPYSTGRLPVILPGRNSILSGNQHPHSPYSSSQADSTWYYRILPGEIGFISKWSSIVYLCNTKVSVFQTSY